MTRTPTPNFAFLLAERLSMTVAELEHTMSNLEFTRWRVLEGRRAQRQQQAEARAKK